MDWNKLCFLFSELRDDLELLEKYVFELRAEKTEEFLSKVDKDDLTSELDRRGYDVELFKRKG